MDATKRLEFQFRDLETRVLSTVRVGDDILNAFLVGIDKSFLRDMVMKMSASAAEDIEALCLYWNYFDPVLLEYVIAKYGDDELRQDMEIYNEALKAFRQKTRLRDWVGGFKPILFPSGNSLSLMLDRHWDDFMLEDVESLRLKICEILPFLMKFVGASGSDSSCVQVNWILPQGKLTSGS